MVTSRPIEQSNTPPERTEALQALQQQTALDLASLVGGAGGLNGFREVITAMRPGSTLSDSQLPHRNIRDNNGDAVETRRPDGSLSRTYNTGARMELDSRGRLIGMTLPGPRGAAVSLEYEGNNTSPSAVHMNFSDKQGRLTFQAGENTRLEVNPQLGYVSVTSPEGGATMRVTGQTHQLLQDGSVRSNFYNHGDRSNTTEHVDLRGNVLMTQVNRADGSGHTIYDGNLMESRFAPGTNVSYTDLAGNQHNFNGVRQMWYSTNAAGGNDISLTTNDGRDFHLSNVWGNGNGQNFVGQVQQGFRKKW